MLLPLSERQSMAFKVILDFISDNNYPPTIPELQEIMAINNPGAVHKLYSALEKKGYIIRNKGMHRGINLTDEAKDKMQ